MLSAFINCKIYENNNIVCFEWNTEISNDKKVYNRGLDCEDNPHSNYLIISSNEILHNIIAVPYAIDKKLHLDTVNKESLIELLTPNEVIKYNVDIPGCVPIARISFSNNKGYYAYFDIAENGRDGNMIEKIKYHTTFKAFIYELITGGIIKTMITKL